MDQRTESIKQDIDQTRDSMTEKMEQIESQVYGTVDNIKESASETVQQVKHQLDVKRMVNEHPWTMLGASMLTGFVLGNMGGGSDKGYSSYSRDYPVSSAYDRYDQYERRSRRQYRSDDDDRYFEDHPTQANASDEHHRMNAPAYQSTSSYSGSRPRYNDNDYNGNGGQSRSSRSSGGSGIMSGVQEQFGDELTALKHAAIATATNTIRSLLQENVPRFAEEFDRARREREQDHGDSNPDKSSRTQENQGQQEFQQTEQTSETPTSIVAPVTNGEKDKTFKTSHQSGTVSSSINAPAERSAEH